MGMERKKIMKEVKSQERKISNYSSDKDTIKGGKGQKKIKRSEIKEKGQKQKKNFTKERKKEKGIRKKRKQTTVENEKDQQRRKRLEKEKGQKKK